MGKLTVATALFCLVILFSAKDSQPAQPTIDQPVWEPDAGLVASFTKGGTVSTSSNPSQSQNILDDDPNTAWQSDAPLPEGFLKRADLNVFLKNKTLFPSGNGGAGFTKAVDGDLSTAASVPMSGRQAKWVLEMPERGGLFSISLKCNVRSALTLHVLDEKNNIRETLEYPVATNFQLKRFELKPGGIGRIELVSTDAFEVFEIGALTALPTEFAMVDLGAPRPVGSIYVRHFAGEGAAVATCLYLSLDGKEWTRVDSLLPDAVHTFISNVSPEQTARFVKIEHRLVARDWNKVFLWEVHVYDKDGHYGARPAAQKGYVPVREMLGVNGYWSWGTDEYSDLHTAQQGPLLYRPVAAHARNYHDMTWDIKAPGDRFEFSEMAAGKGTPVNAWLNWDREYKAWKAAGLAIQTSLQFYKFKPSDWKNPRQDAYQYAESYARHYGPTNGNGLVCTIEAGNEPWEYDAATYRQILLGMAEGARAGDKTLEVFPCALQAADPAAERTDVFKNYIGARLPQEAAKLLDGINVHCYSYINDRVGVRRAVRPEHPNSTFWEILNAIRWRNANMPGKKIYLSEWGWDSEGGGEDCSHGECVSERAAALYAVRGALIASRLGVERASWFYYANEKQPSSRFTRSGLTASGATGFAKKMPFVALQSLANTLGDKVFLEVVREDETAWAYLFGNADGTSTHLVAWKPADGDDGRQSTFFWKTKAKATGAFVLDGSSQEGKEAHFPKKKEGGMEIGVSVAPMVVVLGRG